MNKTTDDDRLQRKILKEVGKVDKAHVDVGLFGEDKHDDGASIVGIGAVHEFGSEKANVPERSYIRSTVDKNSIKWFAKLNKSMELVLGGKTNVVSALTAFGEMAASQIRRTITKLRTPPLSPKTIARKKSSNPLIDTGAMRANVRARVVAFGVVLKETAKGAL